MQLIILKKFETLPNLLNYDMEDYLALFELVLVSSANEALSMANLSNINKK
jgi:hypothetical protein